MLPSNPSVSRGLPTTPRVQSRPTSRPTVDKSNSQEVRPSGRSRPNVRRLPKPSQTINSSSSDGPPSPLFDSRNRGRSSASSDTSLDDDTGILHNPDSEQDECHMTEVKNADDAANYASWFGNYFARAAQNLTVNATKAWSAHIITADGEETPPGHDSRLTRVMKAYHLEKARDPTDLPGWLFGASERRVPLRQTFEPPEQRGTPFQAGAPEAQYPGVLRVPAEPASSVNNRGTSKATERLRAIRDNKRNTSLRKASLTHFDSRVDGRQSGGSTANRQMGLPSGPRRKI